MPSLGTAAQTERPEHHVDLNNAVQDIDNVLEHLDKLYSRINGPQPEDPKDLDTVKEPQPTLAHVLDSTPDCIRGKMGEAHSKIDAITASIF